MKDRLFTPAAMATLLGLTTTAVTAAEVPGAINAEQGWSSITRCAQEDTERARHTCVDRILRDAGLLTNEMHARQQRNAFGLQDKPAGTSSPAPASAATKTPAASAGTTAPAASAVPAANAAASANAASPTSAVPAASKAPTASSTAPAANTASTTTASPAEPTDRLEVELAKVEKAINGRLLVTTKEGAAWLQTESLTMPLPPVVGDHMSIRKGALGGYRCTVASTQLTYRCIRSH